MKDWVPTKVSIISAQELDAGLLQTWERIQGQRSDLVSPYYRPEFTQAVAASRDDVRIAIFETEEGVAGFFPFHAEKWGQICSVGSFLSDYHGLIADGRLVVAAPQLLHCCNARYFGFNHMPLTQKAFLPFVRAQINSLIMDLEGGLECYKTRLLAQPGRASNNLFRFVAKHRRRLERDHGTLRFVINEPDEAAYRQLLQLKSAQFVRTRGSRYDPLAQAWVRNTLGQIRARDTKEFSGMLSALYVDEKLVAAHFGMRSKEVLHGWFLAYDPDYSYYSPGMILVMSLAEEACKVGISSFDMGRGHQAYKQRFATSAIPLGDGAVSIPAWLAQTAMLKNDCHDYLKSSIVGDIWRARKQFFHA